MRRMHFDPGDIPSLADVSYEPGWLGMFTRAQAAGAIPNGTLIKKATHDPGDTHPVGTLGTVLGSVRPPGPVKGWEAVEYFYFVEWHRGPPRIACGCLDYKIRPASAEGGN